jgi:hypothetical protein
LISQIKKLSILFFTIVIITINPVDVLSQVQQRGQQLGYSQQFRLGERIIRVAEPGQLADSVNVWGDINSPGRYLIPIKTTLPKLISYSFGPRTLVSGQTQLDWSKVRVEVNISEYNENKGQEVIRSFEYRFEEPLPEGMRSFDLENNQVVSLQVKRRPSFADYVGVIAPVISAIATSIIILDRL